MSGSGGTAPSSIPPPGPLLDSLGNPIITTDIKSVKSLSKDEIANLVKKVSSDTIKSTLKKVESIQGKDVEPMEFSIFEFQGFDPLTIQAVLIVVNEHFKGNMETLLSDIKFSIAACLYMGNLQEKSLLRRKEEGRSKIEYLASKYDIVTGTTGTSMSAETVTFPRIVASFPVLAIRMAWKVPPNAVNREFLSMSIPSYMRLSPFASLCSPNMDSELRIFLMEACNAHGSDMSIAYEVGRLKVRKVEIKYDPISIANDQWQFVDIASNSPVPSEESRKELLTELNISTDYESLAKVVSNYRAILQKKKTEDIKVLSKDEFDKALSDFISS